jgi:hypothetical protein
MGKNGVPFTEEDLIASAVEALKVRGDARAIAVLITGKCKMHFWDSDFGIDSWRLFIALPVHLFYAMSEDERKATEKVLEEVIDPFFLSTLDDSLKSVVLTPLVVEAQDGWREEALRATRFTENFLPRPINVLCRLHVKESKCVVFEQPILKQKRLQIRWCETLSILWLIARSLVNVAWKKGGRFDLIFIQQIESTKSPNTMLQPKPVLFSLNRLELNCRSHVGLNLKCQI